MSESVGPNHARSDAANSMGNDDAKSCTTVSSHWVTVSDGNNTARDERAKQRAWQNEERERVREMERLREQVRHLSAIVESSHTAPKEADSALEGAEQQVAPEEAKSLEGAEQQVTPEEAKSLEGVKEEVERSQTEAVKLRHISAGDVEGPQVDDNSDQNGVNYEHEYHNLMNEVYNMMNRISDLEGQLASAKERCSDDGKSVGTIPQFLHQTPVKRESSVGRTLLVDGHVVREKAATEDDGKDSKKSPDPTPPTFNPFLPFNGPNSVQEGGDGGDRDDDGDDNVLEDDPIGNIDLEPELKSLKGADIRAFSTLKICGKVVQDLQNFHGWLESVVADLRLMFPIKNIANEYWTRTVRDAAHLHRRYIKAKPFDQCGMRMDIGKYCPVRTGAGLQIENRICDMVREAVPMEVRTDGQDEISWFGSTAFKGKSVVETLFNVLLFVWSDTSDQHEELRTHLEKRVNPSSVEQSYKALLERKRLIETTWRYQVRVASDKILCSRVLELSKPLERLPEYIVWRGQLGLNAFDLRDMNVKATYQYIKTCMQWCWVAVKDPTRLALANSSGKGQGKGVRQEMVCPAVTEADRHGAKTARFFVFDQSLVGSSPGSRNTPCLFWVRGGRGCRYGYICPFTHNPAASRDNSCVACGGNHLLSNCEWLDGYRKWMVNTQEVRAGKGEKYPGFGHGGPDAIIQEDPALYRRNAPGAPGLENYPRNVGVATPKAKAAAKAVAKAKAQPKPAAKAAAKGAKGKGKGKAGWVDPLPKNTPPAQANEAIVELEGAEAQVEEDDVGNMYISADEYRAFQCEAQAIRGMYSQIIQNQKRIAGQKEVKSEVKAALKEFMNSDPGE